MIFTEKQKQNDGLMFFFLPYRRKFGAQGWNRNYPFNNGDLTISVNVLYNYLEANSKVPCKIKISHCSLLQIHFFSDF
jgi:hypothetical protein